VIPLSSRCHSGGPGRPGQHRLPQSSSGHRTWSPSQPSPLAPVDSSPGQSRGARIPQVAAVVGGSGPQAGATGRSPLPSRTAAIGLPGRTSSIRYIQPALVCAACGCALLEMAAAPPGRNRAAGRPPARAEGWPVHLRWAERKSPPPSTAEAEAAGRDGRQEGQVVVEQGSCREHRDGTLNFAGQVARAIGAKGRSWMACTSGAGVDDLLGVDPGQRLPVMLRGVVMAGLAAW